MISSPRTMLLSLVLCSSLFVMVISDGPEYLPPSKGYNYDRPNIPFDTNNNGNKPHDHGQDQYGHDHGPDHHHEPGMPFDFAYQVTDDGNDYSHNAISDGDITRGEYRVALPDGRTQIVKYTADWKNGFNAEVTYEGEARYPEPPAGGYGPSPSNSYGPPSQGGGYQY